MSGMDFGTNNDCIVVACLPRNSLNLAIKAEEARVDVVQLCVDGDETSYPGHYGSYELHSVYINDIVSTLKIPCGIMLLGQKQLNRDYWENIMKCNFSFVEMYAHMMPLFLLSDNRIKKVAAISSGYMVEQVRKIASNFSVDAIDVAIATQQTRGTLFSLMDFSTLQLIVEISEKPVLYRIQKKMEREEIIKITQLGIRGVIIDPWVLSGTDETYREEIERLSPKKIELQG